MQPVRSKHRVVGALLLAIALVATACGRDLATLENDIVFPEGLADPTEGDANLPDGYRLSFPRDQILPIYTPVFTSPSGVDWPDDELVIGVEIDGDARAYPVGFLNRREIVSDLHRGIPTLVSW